MRRLFLIAALFLWTPAGAQNDDATPRKIEKETFVYAVRDADTLRLDRYALLSPDSRAKPCLMFLFGGGFMTGTRDNRRFRPFFDYYARKGFVVVSIDYRLGMKRARQAGLLDEEHFTQALDMTLSMATEDLYDATAYAGRRSFADRDVRVERRGHHGADGRVLALQRASADRREVHAGL